MNQLSRLIIAAISLSILSITVSCDQKQSAESDTTAVQAENDELISTDVVANTTEITFDQDKFNFGDIKEGDVVTHDFKFTNTGDHDLIIAEAKKTCGCTVTNWPKHPIKPGDSEYIKIEFDSNNKEGAVNKAITVIANTKPSETKIYITGTVVK